MNALTPRFLDARIVQTQCMSAASKVCTCLCRCKAGYKYSNHHAVKVSEFKHLVSFTLRFYGYHQYT